ncbi:MAG: hypothetical protein JRH07_11535 [Deltaproteobacteria bacterium]|nr:hypothetical protein [Deltaproteobacteria bacterium]MBW2122464.1 hypothetical protein [Deltaproteobacteria bacterium]
MTAVDASTERRRFKRVSIEFPVSYKIRGTTILGRAINACNQGMMVESYVGVKTALQILGMMKKKRRSRVGLEFTHKKTYRTEAEIRHFHFDFSGSEPCRSVVGFYMPEIT